MQSKASGSYLYLIAFLIAFVLYHLDYRYHLNDQLLDRAEELSNLDLPDIDKIKENPNKFNLYLVFATTLIISLVFAIKKVT
jgi:hypothetical protein